MKKILLSVLISIALLPAISLASFDTAGASSWSSWKSNCGKWLLDVQTVEKTIVKDSRNNNYDYLLIDFASLAIDGNHVRSCPSSPDARLNSLIRSYGQALYSTGYNCAVWAKNPDSSLGACSTWASRKNSLLDSVSSRMTIVVR